MDSVYLANGLFTTSSTRYYTITPDQATRVYRLNKLKYPNHKGKETINAHGALVRRNKDLETSVVKGDELCMP